MSADSRPLDTVAFICGCGHSGTTLLATMLSAHPRIHVPLYESEAFLGPPGLAQLKIRELAVEAAATGKSVLVEKTPRHVLRIPEIRAATPGARFLLMVRDGRDVAASIGRRMHDDFQSGVARWISDNVHVVRERGRPDTLLIRYEDLIENPPRVIRRVCRFLGVEYRDDLLAYHEIPRLWFGQTEVREASGVGADHNAHRNWQVNQPIFDGRNRWKTDLPADVAAAFSSEPALGLMRAFNYAS